MKRYSILARRYGTTRTAEICQCDTNPQAIVAAAKEQRVCLGQRGGRPVWVQKFERVHFIDNARTTGRGGK
jgi:hypothetical protein